MNFLADYQGQVICFLVVVMTTRKVSLYKKVFQKIHALFPSLSPQFVMADYEIGLRKSVILVFPEARVLGCRFHFSKSILKKLKTKFKLGSFYNPKGSAQQKQFVRIVRQIMALPLLRSQHLRGEVNRLEQEMKDFALTTTAEVSRRMNAFINYIITFWMRLAGSHTISVYGSPHKTNNVTER